MVKFAYSNHKIQNFSLPPFVIRYILESKHPNMIHKLHKTCKYFFEAFKYPVCHRFLSHNQAFRHLQFPTKALQFYQQSIGIYLGSNCTVNFDEWLAQLPSYKLKYTHKFIISHSLYFEHVKYVFVFLGIRDRDPD